MMHFTDAERETVITWTNADAGTATIYTCQKPIMRRLRNHPHARLVEQRDGGETWEIPVKCVSLRKLYAGGRRKMPPQAVEALKRLQRQKKLHQRGGPVGSPAGVAPFENSSMTDNWAKRACSHSE